MNTKKITALLIVFALSVSLLEAQFTPSNAVLIDNRPSAPTNLHARSAVPVICGTDTAEYPRYKASGFVALGISNNNSFSQFFDAPQDIKVKGFTYYGWMSSLARGQTARVVCAIYKSGADSLPTGTALRTDTMVIDSTFGNGLLAVLEKHATFKTSVTVNYPYVLVVKNIDTSSCSFVLNSYQNGDGDYENLHGATISGVWYRGLNLNVGGTLLNADFQFYPHVQYDYKNNFLVKDQCYKLGDSVKFINLYKNNVLGSKFYNRYIYYNFDRFCFRWYNDNTTNNSYGSVIDGGAKYPSRQNYDVRLISSLYHYRLGYSVCIDTTDITVNYAPIAPIPQGIKTACNGDSLGVKINQNNTEIYSWFKNYTDTTPVFSGLTYAQSPALKNDTFYIQTTNNECKSLRSQNIFTVNQYPVVTRIKNDSICSGANANLEASSDIGITKWYKDSVGGSSFYTGPVLTFGPLLNDTTIYAEIGNTQCVLGKRIALKVLVGSGFAPDAPIVSNDTTLCLQNASTISLNASAISPDVVRWFDSASGGTVLSQSNKYNFTPSKAGVFIYYADAWNGVCGSSRVPVKITINTFEAPKNVTNDEICIGNNASLSAQISNGTLSWYEDTAQTALNTGNSYTIVKPLTTAKYYLKSSYLGCTSYADWSVTATVNKPPIATNLVEPTVCAAQTASLSMTLPYGEVNWFTDTLTGTSFNSTTQFTTPILFGSKTYFYQTSFKGCKSYFKPITANVNIKPAAGFTYSISNLTGNYNALTNPNITSYNWDMGNGTAKTGAVVNYTYPAAGIYNVKLIVTHQNGCKDTNVNTINVGRVGIDQISGKFFIIYPNPAVMGYLEIKTDMDLQNVSVVNMEGKILLNETILEMSHGNYFINFDLPKAIYLVRLTDKEGKIFTQRVIKE